MLYVFKDGSGFQAFPAPGINSKPYIEVSGSDEGRLLAGEPYRVNATMNVVEFPPLEEVEAERAAEALEAERAAMVVSRFQARAALMGSGLLATADAAIQGADEMAKLAWADAQEFRRNSPLVAAIAAQLGMDEIQLDYLFRQAANIEA